MPSKKLKEVVAETVINPATRKAALEEKRPVRIPVSANRNILTVKGIPENLVGRWVNDTDDRVHKFLEGGYEFWTDKQNTKIGDPTVNADSEVGNAIAKKVGGGITSYLMVIPKEWYEKDQKAKQDDILAVEDSMKAELNSGNDGTYGSVKTDEGQDYNVPQ